MERLNGTLQENVITLLAHSDTHGKIVSNIVDPALFEGEYRTLAERCIDYWRRHGEAPKYHTPDLVSDILEDKHNRRAGTYKRILNAMVDLADNINTDYVMTQLHSFVRMQRFKDAVVKSAEQLNARQEMALEDVEAMWNDLLTSRQLHFDPGAKLTDIDRVLNYIASHGDEFVTGIPQLDDREVVPARGEVMILLAPAKRGKSWFLVNVATRALVLRKRVVHITLEMDEEQSLQRYYQNMFAVTKGEAKVVTRILETDDRGRLTGFDAEKVEPDFTLSSPSARDELRAHIDAFGAKAEYLRVKRFPTRTLTVRGIDAYLDSLEVSDGFIPDMIILDYIGIMKTDERNHRISLGRAFEDFRGLCVRRNVAGVTAHQTSKAGAEALMSSAGNVAEDWSMIGTADIILNYSSTDAEKRLGLGRLRVSAARRSKDGFGVLLSQSYESGQFIIDSVPLDQQNYFEMLEDFKDMDDDTEDGDDEAGAYAD